MPRRIAPPRLERRLADGNAEPRYPEASNRYAYAARRLVYDSIRVYDRHISSHEEKGWHIVETPKALLNGRGRRLTPYRYEDISRFDHGLAQVSVADTKRQPGGEGFIDRQGREVLPPRYYYVSGFAQGGTVVIEATRQGRQILSER